MNVSIVSTQGIFRDLLASAVNLAGYNVDFVVDDFSDAEELPSEGCLIAYSHSADPEFCEHIRQLRESSPELGITLVCPPDLESELVDQLGFTVNGVIPETRPLDLVIDSLTVVSQGYALVDRQSACVIAPDAPKCAKSPSANAAIARILSDREATVLACIRDGHSNKEIARDLSISDSTVKVHMRSIFRKIGVKNRTQAAIWAASHI